MATDPIYIKGVIVPPHRVAEIEQYVKELEAHGKKEKTLYGYTKDYVDKLLAEPVHQDGVPSAGVAAPASITLAEACHVIVEHLEQPHQNVIHALAKEKRLPLEAFIMSPLTRSYDKREVGIIMQSWLNAKPVEQEAPIGVASICEYCRKPFTPEREGQRFCPPPPDESDPCGRKWGLEQIKAQVESRRKPPSQFAPPRQPHLKSVADRVNSSLPDGYVQIG